MVGFGLLTSCISVNLSSSDTEKAKALKFDQPGQPFSEIKTSSSDRAFKSPLTGTTIAYFSACGPKADVSLNLISQDVLSSFDRVDQQSSQLIQIDGREGVDLSVIGMIDGVQTRIRSAAFKKNGCMYTLTYVALPRFYDSEMAFFNQFISNFRAP